MRKFLNKIIFFLLPLFGFFVFNTTVNYFIYSSQKIDLDNPSILIIGDSHPQKSINPKLLTNAVNISQPGEPYILTFWKLNKILESNKPDTVIIGFAPHNISEFNDLKFSKKELSVEMFRRSYSIQNFSELEEKIEIDFVQFWKTYLKQTSFYPKLNHVNFIGKYSNSHTSDVSGWEAVINRHYYLGEAQLGISQTAIDYLDSIIDLCLRKDIMVILTSSPVHIDYYEAIPQNILNRYESLKSNYTRRTLIFDRTNDFTYPDSLFLDSDHLNSFGAKKFTNELNEFIK